MAMLEKFPPIGYVTPANCRRFIAKNGSGRVLSFTSAATTVAGTVTLCQPSGAKFMLEMTSPLASTLTEDWSLQSSRRASFSVFCPEAFWSSDWQAERSRLNRKHAATNIIAKNFADNNLEINLRNCFVEFMSLPRRAIIARAKPIRGPQSGNKMDNTSIDTFQ